MGGEGDGTGGGSVAYGVEIQWYSGGWERDNGVETNHRSRAWITACGLPLNADGPLCSNHLPECYALLHAMHNLAGCKTHG